MCGSVEVSPTKTKCLRAPEIAPPALVFPCIMADHVADSGSDCGWGQYFRLPRRRGGSKIAATVWAPSSLETSRGFGCE
jgi:hypothetical protein